MNPIKNKSQKSVPPIPKKRRIPEIQSFLNKDYTFPFSKLQQKRLKLLAETHQKISVREYFAVVYTDIHENYLSDEYEILPLEICRYVQALFYVEYPAYWKLLGDEISLYLRNKGNNVRQSKKRMKRY